jgi:hypothetical protein
MPANRTWSDEQLIQAVRNERSIAGVIKALGIKVTGGQYVEMRRHFERLGLDTSHFTGQGWNKDKRNDISVYLENRKSISSARLKSRLFEDGIKERVCESCGVSAWNGKPIVLELHHKNGNKNDNTLENIMILCPNCHSQTDNFRNRTTSVTWCP